MSKRYDICAPRAKKDGTTYWVKVGVCWENDNGSKQLVFDALPIPDAEGRCVANLFEPRDKQDAPPARQQTRNAAPADDDMDSVPF